MTQFPRCFLFGVLAMTADCSTHRLPNRGRAPGTLRAALSRFVADDSGQDLVEYALLSAAIGLAAVAVVDALSDSMSAAYTSWDTAAQSDPLVEMPNPVAP